MSAPFRLRSIFGSYCNLRYTYSMHAVVEVSRAAAVEDVAGLRESVTEALKPLFRRRMDPIPDPQDVQESVETVHVTVELALMMRSCLT